MERSLVDVNFERAKSGFMTLERHTERVVKALGSVEVDDDALVDRNRFRRDSHRLRIESEVDDEFFWRAVILYD